MGGRRGGHGLGGQYRGGDRLGGGASSAGWGPGDGMGDSIGVDGDNDGNDVNGGFTGGGRLSSQETVQKVLDGTAPPIQRVGRNEIGAQREEDGEGGGSGGQHD